MDDKFSRLDPLSLSPLVHSPEREFTKMLGPRARWDCREGTSTDSRSYQSFVVDVNKYSMRDPIAPEINEPLMPIAIYMYAEDTFMAVM